MNSPLTFLASSWKAAAYQIVLEHRVGPFRFHEGTVVMAAGNLEEDDAIVSSLSSALCNRFAHFVLRVDPRSWLDWGASHGVDERILAYVGRHGEDTLYKHTGDLAFPSPRAWEMASRVLRIAGEQDARRVVAACVGVEAALRFHSWLRIWRQVDPEKIVLDGEPTDFSNGRRADPSFAYAAMFSVAAWLCTEPRLEEAHLGNVVRFLRSPGLDPEYAFLFLRQIRRKATVYDRLKPHAPFRELAGDLVSLNMEMYQ